MSREQIYRDGLPPVPWRLRHRPVVRGFPLPWFCPSDDFRVADGRKMSEAIRSRKCWICGQPLGRFLAFCIGPMCAINRTISEPPSHRECAEWSALACPFLTQRQVRRRENDLPETGSGAAGIAITRQPGVTCLWTTKSYRVIRVEAGEGINPGILFKIGDPLAVVWYREGRPATRAEVLASIDSGYPILLEAAEQDGPGAVQELAARREKAMALLPEEAPLVAQAEALCSELQDIIRRMTEPDDDFEAYNDYHMERIQDTYDRAIARLERRRAARNAAVRASAP